MPNLFKVNNNDTRWRHWFGSGVFIVNFNHILQHVLVLLLIILVGKYPPGSFPFSQDWKSMGLSRNSLSWFFENLRKWKYNIKQIGNLRKMWDFFKLLNSHTYRAAIIRSYYYFELIHELLFHKTRRVKVNELGKKLK